MLYGSKVGFLICSMVYKPLGKFEPYMFWRQGFISLELKPLKMVAMSQRRVNMGGKCYSKQVGLIMNIKNDLRLLQFHIVAVTLVGDCT